MTLRIRLLALAGCVLAVPATAGDVSPVGFWTTIDDHTHEARSIVEIAERDGALSGRIVRLFRKPDEIQDPVCKECGGARHDARVIGMEILWGVHRRGAEWSGGADKDVRVTIDLPFLLKVMSA